jgi:catechol 2,3-dioxygenase-like lactoylglutathione lyase family enzyme
VADSGLLTRLEILGALALAVALIAVAVNARRRWTLGRVRGDPGSTPGLLYFTTESCVQCQTRQWPAIQSAMASLGAPIDLKRIDAIANPDLASRWGVLTVPTTVVLDRAGRALAVNYGVAESPKLVEQLRRAGLSSEGGPTAHLTTNLAPADNKSYVFVSPGRGAEVAGWTTGISAITLFVEDLAAAKQFYRDAFGLPIVFEDDNSAVFNFGNTVINLLKTAAARGLIEPAVVASRQVGSRLQLTITVDDVDATCAELAKRGVKLLNGPMDRPWGIRTASFQDPGGHIWEIAH